MTVQEFCDETVKSIIIILLNLEEKNRSLADDLQEVISREAAEIATRRVGGNIRVGEGNYAAVVTIAAQMGSRAITDFAIEKCLEICEAGKNEFVHLRSNDALDTATKLAFCGASKNQIERVVAAVAESGWYGRIEGLARKLLGRGLTVTEVMALVDHYVNDKGIRSSYQEEKLLRMAQTYAPGKTYEVRRKIEKFVKDFEGDDCY